ncbi:uncharacterized protein H6S33_010496 [Morchella sextelata]|uniref:uncharacterized protein n=1 Tax=Morchella sextelata TaxID=1174677 RepID=UPI001D04F143|nr:uncharacterized protein H6S33_010496 [Morchella sextelata]KAH0612444.1 hypothetical protein H6S33_010496 [Morchella sextelata]
MKDQIPTGSYVIRNKQTSSVIHVDNPATASASLNKKWSVVACEQNESRYPEQQVWWVEPFPTSGGGDDDDDDDGEAVTYSITNCATGRCLDANLGGANAYYMPRHEATKGEWRLVAYENKGAPWQKWRIENVSDDKDEPYYRIVNVWNNELLSIARSGAESGESGPRCNIGKAEATPVKTWEFIVPIVAFPPGWCRIQNCETLDLLSQSYLSNPPVLLNPPASPPQPQFRESWAEQWVLAHTSYLFPDYKIGTGANTWCVRNRLTGGYLGCVYNDRYPFIGGQAVSANDWDLTEDDISAHTWKLEIDPSCTTNWKLIHHKTGFLLERGEGMVHGGVEVQCKDKKFARGNKHKTWHLVSPVVESAEAEAPPEYEIQAQ